MNFLSHKRLHLCVQRIWYSVVWDHESHHEMKKRLMRSCHSYHSSFYLISSVIYFPGTCTYACQQSVTLLHDICYDIWYMHDICDKCSDWLKMMDYLCKFLTSDPCVIMPRSLTKCRIEPGEKKKLHLLI